MRTYGQYCPIARAAEILAERWTPLILRNLLLGSTTFGQIADGAPGIPRSLLVSRLRALERAGVVEARPNERGRGSRYGLTTAGNDLGGVMLAMGSWGERWLELAPEHLDPGVVLNSWVSWYLARDLLPDRRVVVRFDFPDRPRKADQLWIIFDGERSEICRTNPGYDEDLVVTSESLALSEWHLGRLEWTDALQARRIQVAGPIRWARELPTWNRRSGWARLGIQPERQRAS
jgi:DNA-binding HxlR family transcriptional regulator